MFDLGAGIGSFGDIVVSLTSTAVGYCTCSNLAIIGFRHKII
jgi:hypothetical protein